MKKIVLIIVIFALLVTGASFSYQYLSKNIQPDTDISDTNKTPATDFSFTDMDGNEVKLSDYYGKPIILNFWASWCSPCKNEMPAFDDMSEKYKDKVSFIMLNVTDGKRETVASAKDFISGTNYTFPVFFDTKSEGVKAYSLTGVPMTIVIDKDGNIAKTFRGEVTSDTLTSIINELMK